MVIVVGTPSIVVTTVESVPLFVAVADSNEDKEAATEDEDAAAAADEADQIGSTECNPRHVDQASSSLDEKMSQPRTSDMDVESARRVADKDLNSAQKQVSWTT